MICPLKVKNEKELEKHKRITGAAPTLDDLLNPVQEKEVGDSPFRFPGGDVDILAEVRRVSDDTVVNIESDDKSDTEPDVEVIFMKGFPQRYCRIVSVQIFVKSMYHPFGC